MKPSLSSFAISSLLLLLIVSPAAARQEVAAFVATNSPAMKARAATPTKAEEVRSQIRTLKRRRDALRMYLSTISPDLPDASVTRRSISELEAKIESLSLPQDGASSGAAVGFAENTRSGDASIPGALAQGTPEFFLSRPVDRKSDESVQPTLAWTEDRNGKATKYIVEVATDPTRKPDGTFVNPVFTKEVDPKGVAGQSITLGEDEKLQPGVTYFWHVLARYAPGGGGANLLQPARRGRDKNDLSPEPRTFHTVFNIFARLENKGFTLQRTVAGDDATEGAQFSFLRSFNKGTVYSTTFALIHNHDFPLQSTWAFSSQFSVEGALTSDESESEDAWRFRGGLIMDHGGKSLESLRGFYLSLAAKMEADQDFETKKLAFEGLFVPTIASLNMGATSNSDASKSVQFRWRPYFGIDAGHTFRRGDSSETESTILRLAPRVRPVLYLNFLRNALGIKSTYLYADNTFYYLPLENTKRRHNFFVSGFNFDVSPNFGFGLTYKNGESAPKFKRVNTLGGVLTVRFGKEE
ncbi:MAG: hypothetical protein LC785_12950 [Acidobacteria bacterium]|nr:hypothetical protein [Acidobacteriota bacterium]MCA1642824.1 hypothetical protein [Acidobacteriota bacterium]